jgi:hypothetical protein
MKYSVIFAGLFLSWITNANPFEKKEQIFFSQCKVEDLTLSLYRTVELQKEFFVTVMAGKNRLFPVLARAEVRDFTKDGFAVHFTEKWGIPDFTSKDCGVPIEPIDRELIQFPACLYFLFDPSKFEKVSLEELVKNEEAIPVKATVLCETPEAGSPSASGCLTIRVLDKIIPVGPPPHKICSLP